MRELSAEVTERRTKAPFIVAGLFIIAAVFYSCNFNSHSGEYTYRSVISPCTVWSPTEWSTINDGMILGYISSPFYAFIPNTTKNGYEVFPELAAEEPTDVTILYAGNSKYGIPDNAQSGYAWRIRMNSEACWDDGTPVNTDTVEFTIKQFLDPAAKALRSNMFYTDELPLANAREYFAGDIIYKDVVTDNYSSPAPDSELWTSLYQEVYFFGGYSIEEFGSGWWQEEGPGQDLWNRLEESFGQNQYVRLTLERKQLLQELAKTLGSQNPDAYREFCFTREETSTASWDQVGFIKDDDYTFTLIFTHQMTRFMVEYGAASMYLIKPDLYQACIKYIDGQTVSTYCTGKETSASYGPYSISDFNPDSYISLTKNKNWFGWTDGKHKGQYMTTDMHFPFIQDHNRAVELFLEGKLDSINLEPDSINTFQNSKFLLSTPRSQTFKYTINIDRATLESRNKVGTNHSILANVNFRKAISFAIDRQEYVDSTRPCSTAGYGLINNTYIAVPETGSSYRDSEEAKAALKAIYGTSTPKGTNLELARELMKQAYAQELQNGNIMPTDMIQLDFYMGAESETNIKRMEILQEALNKATQGTHLEGKIYVNKIVTNTLYQDIKDGLSDIVVTAWGGGNFDPYGLLWCYNSPEAIYEYGFHPEEETLAIEIEGKSITKTYLEWYQELCYGQYADSDPSIRQCILAANEKGHLERYNMIPVEYYSDVSLNSMRLEEYSDHYINSLVERGGIRFLTYTMDDEKWKAWCAKKGNSLDY